MEQEKVRTVAHTKCEVSRQITESCKILYRLVEEGETAFASLSAKRLRRESERRKNEEKCREAMLQI